MIQIDGVHLSYQGDPLFEEVSFSLQKGERIGLVGRNGSGKTTLFRMIMGQETPDKGTISFARDYRIGILKQHIRFEKKSVLEEASLSLHEKDCLYKVEAILFGLGFKEEDMSRSPQDLSGGYQLRLHLAKLLIEEPDCLLLDEPTNYLDIVSIRWFQRFLKQFRGEFILVSHDRSFLDSVSTHIVGIHRKKVRKVAGGTEDYFAQILQAEEVHERTRVNLEKKREHLESFIERFGAKASKAAQAQSRKKMVEKMPALDQLSALSSLHFRFQEAPFSSEKMVGLENLSFSFGSPLLSNLSLTIEKGDRVALIGKNGRGKSTLLRLIARELEAHAGLICSSEHLRIGYFGQTNIDRLDPSQTVFHEISKANPLLPITEVHGICGLMMFSGSKADKRTSILSGGEKSRVLLGKIVATPCNLLLLDEPTHHLDMESIEALLQALDAFEGSIILVTHSEHILERYQPNKILLFHEGEQSFFLGNYEEFLEKKGWPEEKAASKPKKELTFQQEKQVRAERVRARAQVLKPIEAAIQSTEQEITLLEREQHEETEALIEASQMNDSIRIQVLSKSLSSRLARIESLYATLDDLFRKKDLMLSSF